MKRPGIWIKALQRSGIALGALSRGLRIGCGCAAEATDMTDCWHGKSVCAAMQGKGEDGGVYLAGGSTQGIARA